jgi:hypothetical protein
LEFAAKIFENVEASGGCGGGEWAVGQLASVRERGSMLLLPARREAGGPRRRE